MAIAATVKQLSDMIQSRLNNRVDALTHLNMVNPLEGIPDEVKKMREIEAGKIRAVMQEQKDLLELIKLLFPNA
ncbi:MAG: hypothetical protein ACTHMM_16710 [Agriterribacter sp.]